MTTMTETKTLDQLCVDTIRTLSMDAVQKANSGHPGTPMALAPVAYVLYTRLMRHNPADAQWPDRDRFVLSCGHASMLLYSVLYLTGYGLTLDDLKNFRQLGSPTAGHPEYGHAAGIETTTGPLGQGISNAVGMALAERMLAARFNRPGHEIVDHHTYTIASDGDLQEGVASEACSLAGHLKLGRLIAFYDDNHIQLDGDTAMAFSEDVPERFEAYGWPPDEHFLVPDEALAHYREAVNRGKEWQSEWEDRLRAYAAAEPELAAELERIYARRLPDGWDKDVPKFHVEDGMMATRKSSAKVIQWAAARVPELVGGSADLASSNLTEIEGGGDVAPGEYVGRNIHFGVREHGMGAIVNGLNLHYFRAFGGTFFNFNDYMKGAVRLAALMRLPAIFLYTHDSIGLGEDGPTHQPIEQLAHLRAVPQLNVVRPAGANETALAWRFAIAATDAPTVLVFSRQGLPTWNPAGVPSDAVERGAYVLRESYKDPAPDLVLMASGSEVYLCNGAADLLEAAGTATRVVSVPCMDTFAAQPQDYIDSILPTSCRARLAVEAAALQPWWRWVGDGGDVLGMTTFGASAPQKVLYEHFGFTPENIADRAKVVLTNANA